MPKKVVKFDQKDIDFKSKKEKYKFYDEHKDDEDEIDEDEDSLEDSDIDENFEDSYNEDDEEEDSDEEGEENKKDELKHEDSDDDNIDQSEEEETETKTLKEEQYKEALKQELNQMSFEEIQKLQNKLGLKKFKEVMSQNESSDKTIANNPQLFKRLNKNRPQEISSKKPVSAFRNIFQVKKKELIDPRFNPAMGEYKPDVFRKQYGFVNDMRKSEKQMLLDQLKEEEDPMKREQIKSALTRIKQQINSFEESEKKEEMKSNFKKIANQDAKEGKKPHFVNKSEQKILELAEKYKELKKSGKIEKFLAKKRKKQLSKDSKHLSNTSKHLRFI